MSTDSQRKYDRADEPSLRDILGESGTQLSDREKCAHKSHLLLTDSMIGNMPADWLFGEWTSREKFQ